MDHAAIVPRLSPAQSGCLIPLRYRTYALAVGPRKLPGDDETPPDFSRQHRRWRGRVLAVSGAAPTRVGGLVLADQVRAAGWGGRQPCWRCRLRHLQVCLTDLLAGRECCVNVRTGPGRLTETKVSGVLVKGASVCMSRPASAAFNRSVSRRAAPSSLDCIVVVPSIWPASIRCWRRQL
jgi:hypothetical protein